MGPTIFICICTVFNYGPCLCVHCCVFAAWQSKSPGQGRRRTRVGGTGSKFFVCLHGRAKGQAQVGGGLGETGRRVAFQPVQSPRGLLCPASCDSKQHGRACNNQVTHIKCFVVVVVSCCCWCHCLFLVACSQPSRSFEKPKTLNGFC